MVVDSSKFMKAGFVSNRPLSEIDTLMTDSGLAPTGIKQLEDAGIHIAVV